MPFPFFGVRNPFLTPGYNPNEPDPQGGKPVVPVRPVAAVMPPAPVETQLPEQAAEAPPDATAFPRPGAAAGADRGSVRIPSLPFEKAGGSDYSPAKAAEYDYYRNDPMGQAEGERISKGINNANVGGFLDRLKSGLKPGLIGLTRGLASGQGLGGGIGGLIAGGAIGAADPNSGRRAEFDFLDRPRIQEQEERAAAQRAQAAAAAKAQREERASMVDQAYKQAQIGNLGSEGSRREAQSQLERDRFNYERGKPITVAPGASVIRPGQTQPDYTAPNRPQTPTLPYSSTDGGVLDRRTGKVEQNPYAKDRAGLDANKRLSITSEFNKRLSGAKSASQRLAVAKQTMQANPDDPKGQAAVDKAQIEFNKAMDDANSYASATAQQYPDQFEGGPGEGGWAYLQQKAKPAATRQGSTSAGGHPSTIEPSAISEFVYRSNGRRQAAGEPLITEEDAVKMFEAKGIKVRGRSK